MTKKQVPEFAASLVGKVLSYLHKKNENPEYIKEFESYVV